MGRHGSGSSWELHMLFPCTRWGGSPSGRVRAPQAHCNCTQAQKGQRWQKNLEDQRERLQGFTENPISIAPQQDLWAKPFGLIQVHSLHAYRPGHENDVRNPATNFKVHAWSYKVPVFLRKNRYPFEKSKVIMGKGRFSGDINFS